MIDTLVYPHRRLPPMLVFDTLSVLQSVSSPIHWAMGFFDGVHCGHRRVLQAAQSSGALRGALTFDRHPLALLRPEKAPLLLTPEARQKEELIAAAGVDVLLRLPFTAELASLSPTEFLDELGAACRIAGICVGANWRFGHGGCGTPDLLAQEGRRRGFAVSVQELAQENGSTVSSSRIRTALAAGQLADAERMLGRAFAIAGVVEHGQCLARKLGFPTANIALPPHAALPPSGVYRVRCRHEGATLYGIANLGLRPTICEQHKIYRLETHFLDWQGDLYGQRLTIELLSFQRPERRFSSLAALQQQIEKDIREGRGEGAGGSL